MPYRLAGSAVYVQRNGKWRLLKRHPTRAKALKHLAALKINTGH